MTNTVEYLFMFWIFFIGKNIWNNRILSGKYEKQKMINESTRFSIINYLHQNHPEYLLKMQVPLAYRIYAWNRIPETTFSNHPHAGQFLCTLEFESHHPKPKALLLHWWPFTDCRFRHPHHLASWVTSTPEETFALSILNSECKPSGKPSFKFHIFFSENGKIRIHWTHFT